jgi:small-conductance mechanosensitive channel
VIVIWAAGIMVSVSWLPFFSEAAVALLAGSGIAALTIGLAAQESLGNAFNGLFISIFKPFEVGDRIHLVNANITGFIEDITLRHTVIRTFMNSRIIIPNSVINKELIENSNFCNPQASSFIDVIITYDSDVELACEIMARVLGEHPAFVDTRKDLSLPKVPVFVRSLGLYGAELRASMWTETILNNFAACSDVRKKIIEEFENENIKISVMKYVAEK